MPEVSVIIPVYNTARYLSECLESVYTQTLHDIEIICINDGSMDHSLQILKDFQHKDARIKIIDQKNAGVSAARNAGLKVATGKYVAFVDSDDTLKASYLEVLYEAAQRYRTDLVIAQPTEHHVLKSKQLYLENQIKSNVLPIFFSHDSLNAVWNRLYLNAIIKDSNLRFPVGKTHAEDAEFNIEFLMHVRRLYVLDYSGYHYRETPDSATRNPARHPYLQNAVDIFFRDWTPIVGNLISAEQMHELKKERLIHNIISQVYIYGNAGTGMSIRTRWKKLREIVSHPVIIQVFREDNAHFTAGFSTYKKQIYLGILRRSVITLYLLTQYSYYRSR